MEKRGVERYQMKVPATVAVVGGAQEVLVLETENVSSKGTFLRTDHAVRTGARVEVELHLALSEFVRMVGSSRNVRIVVEGTVVRTEERGFAVAFGGHYRIKSE